VSTAGSYAFLTDKDSTTSTTDDYYYIGEAEAILVNVSDSHGASQTVLYNNITVGDVLEWYPVAHPECWKRHRVTAILPDPPGSPPRKLFAVEGLPTEVDECLEETVSPGAHSVELRWNPPGAHHGPTGYPIMLQGQPVTGGATYRVAPHSPILIDVPEGMTLVRFTGGIVAAHDPPVGLRDVGSGSTLVLGLHTGVELERGMAATPVDDSRNVAALFDQIVASARSLPRPAEATTFRYDTYDTTGAVATPGSHAFLTDAGSMTSTANTHDALLDAAAIVVNVSDRFGASHETFYNSIAVGDVVEWYPVGYEDCWMRYKITALLPDPPGSPPRKRFAVEWLPAAISCASTTFSRTTLAWSFDGTPPPPVLIPLVACLPCSWTNRYREG